MVKCKFTYPVFLKVIFANNSNKRQNFLLASCRGKKVWVVQAAEKSFRAHQLPSGRRNALTLIRKTFHSFFFLFKNDFLTLHLNKFLNICFHNFVSLEMETQHLHFVWYFLAQIDLKHAIHFSNNWFFFFIFAGLAVKMVTFIEQYFNETLML